MQLRNLMKVNDGSQYRLVLTISKQPYLYHMEGLPRRLEDLLVEANVLVPIQEDAATGSEAVPVR